MFQGLHKPKHQEQQQTEVVLAKIQDRHQQEDDHNNFGWLVKKALRVVRLKATS